MGIAPVAVDTTHDTLIIAEEEDGETGYEVDKDEEGPLLVLPRYVVALDVVHSCCCWPAGLAVESWSWSNGKDGCSSSTEVGWRGRSGAEDGKEESEKRREIWGWIYRYKGTRMCSSKGCRTIR